MYRLPLFDHRVLDLTDGASALTGRLLGDLGAEVIKVEPPSGDSLRGTDGFQALNANKYCCAFDVSKRPDVLTRLAGLSDVLIATAGSIASEGMRNANEALILVLLPPGGSPADAVAAVGAVGLALWDRRRTGLGGLIEVTADHGEATATDRAAAGATEPVSTLTGVTAVPASPWRLSETPLHLRLPAPALGEHNRYVLGSLLGMADPEIDALSR